MAPKILSSILTVLVNFGVGFIFFAVLILALNGYNGSDAAYGIGVFVTLAVVAALVLAVSAFFSVGLLIEKGLAPLAAAALTVFAISLVGTGLNFLAVIAGVGVAEFVRAN